jgi:hypothetical protein
VNDDAPIDEVSAPAGEARRPPRARPHRSDRRSRRPRRLVGALAIAAVFLVGLVVGMAIQDRPRPGGEQTIVNTLRVSTLAPVETLTVTVESP